MYAITHAATALVVKRAYPEAPLLPLLIGVQLVELIWIALTYMGVERFSTTHDAIHLSFLPYSHSLATGVGLAVLVWLGCVAMKQQRLGAALALAVMSHVFLDIIHHEPDIALLPFQWGQRLGLNLAGWPLADLTVETLYGVFCWRLYRGSAGLLTAIVAFNLANIPLMFPLPGTGDFIAMHRWILPTIILIQFLATSAVFLWLAPHGRRSEYGDRSNIP